MAAVPVNSTRSALEATLFVKTRARAILRKSIGSRDLRIPNLFWWVLMKATLLERITLRLTEVELAREEHQR
jgi:hypothetical protein